MFKRTLSIIIIAGVLTVPLSAVHAQAKAADFSKLESGLLSIENPFKSHLPEIKEPEIKMPDRPPSSDTAMDEPKSEPGLPPKPTVIEPVIKERPLPNITISGIIWHSDRPQAIINGKIVDIGDTISEIQITGIRKAEIDGLFDGRHVTLQP